MGYLGLTQLLDENTEILMLVTNSIKNDLTNPNQFISGTALCALGNIANQEMCLALSREVQNQLGSENPLIRKKAALCAVRIIKRVDDIEDKFNPRLTALLEDKNHGVVVSACSLLIHLLENNPKEYLKEFRHCPQLLVKSLKSVLMSGYANASEYDFSGVIDPFMQAKILKLIRLFAQDPSILSSDELNDILAQVATNTDSSKNPGNAVLYECVQTIMSIEADAGLRVLGINILGKFLSSKDANVKYVALSMLQKVVHVDLKSVQRHRTTVLECLKDPDISIRRRALDVAYSLITGDNVKALTKELMTYLVSADAEFKGDLASRICLCIDRYAPDRRWHVDNSIKVLLLAGNHVSDNVVYSLCHVVAGSPELHRYAVHKLFFTSADPDLVQPDALSVASAWIIGEYGHLLLASSSSAGISLSDVLDLMDEMIRRALASAADQAASNKHGKSTSATGICEYVVCAITKLVVKSNQLSSPLNRGRVETTLRRFEGSLSLDLQQRVCELLAIISAAWDDSTRAGLLEVMPPSEKTSAINIISEKPVGEVNLADAIPANAQIILQHVREAALAKGAPTSRRRIVNNSLNSKKPQAGAAATGKAVAGGGFDLDDLLGETTVIPSQVQTNTAAPKVSHDLLNDLFA